MMLSLSAIDMLLVSVIAFSYADLSNIIALTLWVVNNETIDFPSRNVNHSYCSHRT